MSEAAIRIGLEVVEVEREPCGAESEEGDVCDRPIGHDGNHCGPYVDPYETQPSDSARVAWPQAARTCRSSICAERHPAHEGGFCPVGPCLCYAHGLGGDS